ncbi:AAA family ATPase [Macrococcoides canis]|uniref:AAA family ATPase n=1 Tax=Macrococcoides canis TaxID=1855823 RepID=UPI0022B8C42C|nr:AAA family ATPase [Macrococcus canis]WBF52863.1 AAA family ATPase [Macrococcus canis]
MRNYVIIEGSQKFFEKTLETLGVKNDWNDTLFKVIENYDSYRKRAIIFDDYKDTLIIKNISYHGITNEAHYGIAEIIENVTTDDAFIYIHNPTMIIWDFLENENYKKNSSNFFQEEYIINKDVGNFRDHVDKLANNIIGQNDALREVLKSMWYLINSKRKKPYVIMLYGGSSLGKTETVNDIAEIFYKGKYFVKQLSMFMNNTYSDYFFGDLPNSKSLAFDLYQRESNLLFFDEFDKCSNIFYSAFYTLFDNETFMDSTYKVDISNTLIILTSNYRNEQEMINALGLPIYYRIDKYINYEALSTDAIIKITKKEIEKRKEEFIHFYSEEEFYNLVSQQIKVENENGRTIKKKIQETIEDLIFTKDFNKYF